ncbi:hypothetical protein [Bacillus cereus]|uniref:hypothetical protein n=1 Tax=Bacillus cereus TaxID=1396 RepID=UPI00032D77CD|nr:hypothetical protein [Bacillus cereus]EOO13481.1 hypothetical protein IG9_04894 [Bacillus cereus HuA2-9]
MKLVTIISENKIGMLQTISQNNLIQGKHNLDCFDYDNNSILDFLDYLDFQDCEDYCFICLGNPNRIIKLINHLNNLSDTNFHLYNANLEQLMGSRNLCLDDYQSIDFTHLESIVKKDLSPYQLINGRHALITGVYPANINKKLIKHLYIDNIELLEKINTTIINSMGINSAIYCKEIIEDQNSPDAIPFPILSTNQIDLAINNKEYTTITKDRLNDILLNIKETSQVMNESQILGYIDYAEVTNIEGCNRLFYSLDGIYKDYLKSNRISKQIDINYQELMIALSNNENMTGTKNPLILLYPLFLSLMCSFKSKCSTFITPYTSFQLPHQSGVSNFNLIGIKTEDLQMCYSMSTGQFFKVNEVFHLLLEAYIKDMLDNPEVRASLGDSYEILLNEFKELINNA